MIDTQIKQGNNEMILNTKKNIHPFILCIFIVLVSFTSGCAGDTIINDPPADNSLIGMVVHFDEPMAYMLVSEKDIDNFDRKMVEIGRFIMDKSSLERKYSIFNKYPREYFKADMSFTIIGSYWVRGDWFTREFVSDIHYVILKDENGIRSVCSIHDINSIETKIGGELK